MTVWRSDDVEVDTDASRLDLTMIHHFLTTSYWAQGRTREEVARSVEHSRCYGMYLEGRQIGFGRAVTDRLTFAYLADVFVLEPERGRGLGAFLVRCALADPELAAVRHWSLFTRDAHGLYRRFGFGPLDGERARRFLYRTGEAP